jgi:DNA-binding transcriptional regulator YiaG
MSEQCSKCGADALLIRGNHRFNEIGVPVLLKKIKLIKCTKCRTVEPIIPMMSDLINAIAMAVICQPSKLNGQEIRFLRKYVRKSADEFSRLLHVDNTHLSKLENGHTPIGDQTDKYVRLLVLNLSDELQDKIKQFLEMVPGMSDAASNKTHIQIDSETLEYAYA